MAPEIIELNGASTASDIWSLGCTIVEMVTGKPPYADLIPMTAMFKIVQEETPPIPEDVSVDLRDFLVKCFQKNPINRPTALDLLDHAWIKRHNVRRGGEGTRLLFAQLSISF